MLSRVLYTALKLNFAVGRCKSLLDVIPRQAFSVALQAAVNGKHRARNDSCLPKDVTANVMGAIFRGSEIA